MSYARYSLLSGGGSGSGVASYPTFADFPASAPNGTLAVALDTDSLYIFDSGTMMWVLIGGAGVPLSVGTLDSQPKSANGAVIASDQLFMQTADATHAGLVSITTQSFAGNKTFTGTIAASNLSGTNTGDITIAAFGSTPNANGLSLTGQALNLQPADATHSGGLSSTDWNTFNGKQAAGNYITALTGDGTATGPGSVAFTLATVNSNVGSFGSSTSIPSFTVNAKGLITAASPNVVIAPAGTLTGTTLNATVVSSSLTSVGTIATGVWNGTAIDVAHGGTGLTTLTANNVILGNGSSSPTFVAPGTSGNILTSNGTTWTSASAAASGITQLTGDVTAGPGSGSQAATLATVNSNVGSFGSSTSIPSFTVNAKGLITAASGNAVIAPAGTLTGTTLASNVVTSSLTSFGSLVSPLTMSQISTPANPSAGFNKIYFKSDNNAYILDASGNESLLTSTATSAVWSGFHNTATGANAWNNSSGTFADFTNNDASLALTQVNNNNFGTVTGYGATSGASALPGIVFTPTSTGIYFIKVSLILNANVGGNQWSLRLWDGTTTIDSSEGGFNGSQIYFPVTLSGYLNITSLAAVTIRIQGVISGGTSISIVNNGFSGSRVIDWGINQITGNLGITSASMRYYSSSTTISSSLATVVYATQDYDTAAAYSAGVYTVPVDGKYQVNAGLLTNGTIALNNTLIMEIQKNSSVISRCTENAAGAISQFNIQISDTINCVAGDTLRIQVSSSAIGPAIVSSNFDNFLSIIKVN